MPLRFFRFPDSDYGSLSMSERMEREAEYTIKRDREYSNHLDVIHSKIPEEYFIFINKYHVGDGRILSMFFNKNIVKLDIRHHDFFYNPKHSLLCYSGVEYFKADITFESENMLPGFGDILWEEIDYDDIPIHRIITSNGIEISVGFTDFQFYDADKPA
jgi:hypothetical protein